MPRSILIVDSNPGLAGMLEQAFTGAGFSCALALTAEEAVRIASSIPFDLAIVDFHIPDASPRDLVRALRALHPTAILLGVPVDNNPDNPILDELGMQGGLFKPFYLPSLVPYIARILGEPVPSPEVLEGIVTPPVVEFSRPHTHRSTLRIPWLDNEKYLTDVLDQMTLENPVIACMVTRGAELRAWAGKLQRDELSLIARKVVESWADNPGGTLARYIQMPSTGADVYLYSTSLTVDLDLSLLFDPKTPLSITRRRALNFLKALERDPGQTPATNIPFGEAAQPSPAALSGWTSAEPPPPASGGSLQQHIDALFSRAPESPDEFPPSLRRLKDQPATPAERNVPLEPVFESFEEFLPAVNSLPAQNDSKRRGNEVEDPAARDEDDFISEEGPSGEGAELTSTSAGIRRNRARGDFASAMERRLKKNAFRYENAPPPNPEPSRETETMSVGPAETVTLPAREAPGRVRFQDLPVDVGLIGHSPLPSGFEAPTPALVKLCYAIVLTPSFPGARLTPEMIADLEECVRNMAIAYGWKAIRAAIQSGFLAVNIVAPPHVAPAFVIRVLRRQTSQRLVTRFPALVDSNPAPDFWAPGYLLISTDQPPTPQQVSDYIAYTRRAQGLGATAGPHD